MISAKTLEYFSAALRSEIDECENFGEYINKFSASVASMLSKVVPAASNSFENEYLTCPCETFFANPGKCARPLICMLANCAFNGKVRDSIMSAIAIETFQNAALIHDDIADDATSRRNKPCLHIAESLGIALNAGDFALSLVDDFIMHDTTLSDTMKLNVLQEISNMKLKTIAGQSIDIGWSRDNRFELAVEDYFTMATLKTAHYTCATPIVVGAMIAGAKEDTLARLRDFGIKCGLAFQIQDDILNVDKNSSDNSKDFALDIKEGKRTLIALHAINNLPATDSEKLKGILNKNDASENDLKIALSLIDEANSVDYAKNECKNLIDEANDIISDYENSNAALKILKSVPNWCLSRQL